MAADLYMGVPRPEWRKVTEELVSRHPLLGSADLGPAVRAAWDAVWKTTVGQGDLAIKFRAIDPRAQIVGEFFECLLAFALAKKGEWRRGSSKEKDLIFVPGNVGGLNLDVEIKTSGQASGKVFGNRSYVQPGKDGTIDSAARKKRSGYYMCVNFWQDRIYRVRVGWIDPGDWVPQLAPSGQMAGLRDYVYEYKLLDLHDYFYVDAPMLVMDGIGEKGEELLREAGLGTAGDLFRALQEHGTSVSTWPIPVCQHEMRHGEVLSSEWGRGRQWHDGRTRKRSSSKTIQHEEAGGAAGGKGGRA